LITRQEMEFIKTELSVDKQLLTGCGSNGVMPIDSKTDIDYRELWT